MRERRRFRERRLMSVRAWSNRWPPWKSNNARPERGVGVFCLASVAVGFLCLKVKDEAEEKCTSSLDPTRSGGSGDLPSRWYFQNISNKVHDLQLLHNTHLREQALALRMYRPFSQGKHCKRSVTKSNCFVGPANSRQIGRIPRQNEQILNRDRSARLCR